MSLLRKYPRLAKAPLYLDLRRYSLLAPPHPPRFTRKNPSDTGSTSPHFLRDFTKEVKHLQIVRFYSSSNRDAFKAEAPIGIFEEAQNSFDLSSLGGRLGQSFNRLSRHINVYFNRKDILAENAGLVVTTPEYLGRSQRRCQSQRAARERNVSEGKDTKQTLKCKGDQESSGASPLIKENSGLQLFHVSTLATRFGESYSYVANHINSVFSGSLAKVQTQENLETMSFTRGANRRQKRRKMQNNHILNSKDAEISQVKSVDEQAIVEPNSYLHFARHINKYFGAKVSDEVGHQNRRESLTVKKNSAYKNHFSTQSTSQAQGATSQWGQEEPTVPETGGLFHSSRNTSNFGENYFQMSSHINQYFRGQSGLDEGISRNLLKEIDHGSATSGRLKTVSFMDCLRRPTSAIPDLLGAFLKPGTFSQTSKAKHAMTSPEAILNKKVS